MLGPLIVSPRSGQDAFGWCRRVRRLPGLGRTHGGCGDYFEVEENGRIVARICYEPGVVKWCSTVPASGEPDCPFKDGLTLEVLDADGSLLGVETTFHTEWDGGGLALADEVVALCENGDEAGRSADTFTFSGRFCCLRQSICRGAFCVAGIGLPGGTRRQGLSCARCLGSAYSRRRAC